MATMDSDTYKKLPNLGPLVSIELRAIHLHRHLPKSPLTIETSKGQCRIGRHMMPIARKAHAALLAGADCPNKGPLKDVLQALAGDDASDAETASQAEEPTEAVEALCDKLATVALNRVESMLLKAVRTKYINEKERMVESALQAIAEEG